MHVFELEPTALSDSERALQREVRSWLAQRLPAGRYPVGLGMTGAVDRAFSMDLGAKGWLGMTLPAEFGGRGRSAVDRQLVVEELLAVGAPVGFHWVADRQSGPSIAANGTAEQKAFFLPRIAAGEISFAIGMSEPDSGSDLASLRTRAVRSGDDWVVSGAKIWTTNGATADYALCLFRTSDERRGGLTQFIVDLRSDGITISPIPFIDGTSEFCEIAFDRVVVPDWLRLGEVGGGWAQNTSELVLERGGVDRWMSAIPIIEDRLQHGAHPLADSALADLGSIAARLWAFRSMSLSVARMVDAGQHPLVEAALIKDMATRFEQDCVETMLRQLGRPPDPGASDLHESLLARAVLVSPSWTVRGGTTEILRNIIAKELLRP
jgi:alkylation response protein AidB-like acyl-CoA dehydrogenase